MAGTPRAFDSVTCMLVPNDASPSGPRTPWSPIRGWTKGGPGQVATASLLDLEDNEAELPVVSKRGSGATGVLSVALETPLGLNLKFYNAAVDLCVAKPLRTNLRTTISGQV